MTWKSVTRLTAVLWAMSIAQPVWAYDETTVTGGGRIEGTVTLAGEVPKGKAFNLVTFPNPEYCGRISTGTGWRILKEFAVGPEHGLKDVVVALVDIQKGKPFDWTRPTIEARDCRFLPFVTILRPNHEVAVVNMDPVMHDIQAYETSDRGPMVLFNRPLPMNPLHKRVAGRESHDHRPGKPVIEIVHPLQSRDVFVMQCGFHAYMQSWGMIVRNPYYAVTGADGRFALTDVPEGTYQMMVWHAGIPKRTRSVTVTAGGSLTVNVELQAPAGLGEERRMVEHPHFGLASAGKTLKVEPTLEKQGS